MLFYWCYLTDSWHLFRWIPQIKLFNSCCWGNGFYWVFVVGFFLVRGQMWRWWCLVLSVAGKVSVCPYVPELPSDYDGGPWSMQTLHHQGTPADSQAPGKWCDNTRTSEHNLFRLGGNLTFLTFKMDNQLRSGCSITYTFIERRSLVSLVFSNKPFDSHFPRNVARFEVYSPVPALPIPRANAAL